MFLRGIENMRFKIVAYGILLLAAFVSGYCFGYGYWGLRNTNDEALGGVPACRDERRDTNNELPTVAEQIRFLESKGYDCGEPKDIAGPKFCDAINDYSERKICDESAEKWFEGMKVRK
jgi:hypothetical protein